MFRVLPSVLVISILALASAFILAVPVSAEEAVPLEPARLLPQEQGGVDSPAVALRPDGGMITVWSDLATGEIAGRWFLPVGQPVAPESGRFVVGPSGAGLARLAMVRGIGDRYLAVWHAGGPDQALFARAFDGIGTPLGPVRSIAPASFLTPALAARPGGGFVVAYWVRDGETFTVRYRLLSDDGSPLGAIDVDTIPEDAAASSVDVAIDSEGAFTIAWSWRTGEPVESIIAARTFLSAGAPAGPPFELARLDEVTFFAQHDIAAVGAGELLAIWVERQASGSGIVWTRHFHPDGSVAPALRIDVETDPEWHQVASPVLTATPDGLAAAAWSQATTTETRVVGRLLEADASPRGMPFEIAALPDDVEFFNAIDADRDETGRLAFAWGAGFDPGVLPTGFDIFYTAYARRLLETETGCGPILTLDLRTEPAAPTEDDDVRLVFEGLADCAEITVADWSFDPTLGGFRVVAGATANECDGSTAIPFSLPVDVGSLAAGEYPAVFELLLANDGVCELPFDFTVAPGEPTGPPPVPDSPPLVSDELAGFRTWVVITAGGEPVLGQKESACIPETLCVSGRVPGRSEVFVRVVGPKPNGRLWPTLVKFSTSTVEVWLEQVSSGEVEYYRLEGATPGVDELPGLFDREGFLP